MDVVSTAEVPAHERFDFWNEVSSKTWVPCDLRCAPHLERRFQAQVGISELGAIELTRMTTTPYTLRRTPKLIRQADPEAFKLSCTVWGSGMLAQDGRRAQTLAGDLVLNDTSHPYLAEFTSDARTAQVLVLQFPRALLPLPQRDLRNLTAVRIPGTRGVGALSSQFLLQLARRMDEFSPAEAVRLSTLALDVLTTALSSALDADAAVPSHTRRRALLAQIYAFIQQNLGDPHLTPGTIAAAHHISVRHLHELFRTEGQTVAGRVRRHRLLKCRRDLADPRLTAHSISTIAARWGFTSPAHFSQAFRTAYGLSPRQFRQQSTTAHAD